MKLFYWRSEEGNVGDDLNQTLWPSLRPELFAAEDDRVFIGIGSILDDRLMHLDQRPLVFGSGARSALVPLLPQATICFVRGPLSAAALGEARFVTDPAILAPEVFPSTVERVTGRIGFVPYLHTDRAFAERVCELSGMTLIAPQQSPQTFLSGLLQCDLVVAEAMHGAILADTYGVPFIPVALSSRQREGSTHTFKWLDWLESMGLNKLPIALRYPDPADFGSPVRKRLVDDDQHAAAKAIGQMISARTTHAQLSSANIRRTKSEEMLELLRSIA